MVKLTLNTGGVRVGDEVVGFEAKVASVTVDGSKVDVVFEDGERWETSTHFETTVMR